MRSSPGLPPVQSSGHCHCFVILCDQLVMNLTQKFKVHTWKLLAWLWHPIAPSVDTAHGTRSAQGCVAHTVSRCGRTCHLSPVTCSRTLHRPTHVGNFKTWPFTRDTWKPWSVPAASASYLVTAFSISKILFMTLMKKDGYY